MSKRGVLHRIIVLGEAPKRRSSEFRLRHETIPWKDMAGVRDRLVHGYDAVNLGQVWRVATLEVPVVLAAVEPLLPLPGEEAWVSGLQRTRSSSEATGQLPAASELPRRAIIASSQRFYAVYPVDGPAIADSPLGYADKEAHFGRLQE